MSITTLTTITALLDAIDQRILAASIAAKAARAAAAGRRQNECIGTLLPAEQDLIIALDLLRAILTLHRHPLALRAEAEGGAL